MPKHRKTKNKNYLIFKFIVVLIFLISILIILHMSYNYTRNDSKDKTKLIINNNNVTTSLKKDIYINNNVVYISIEDVNNFFDSSIYYDKKYNQIITASYSKLAVLPIDSDKIEINSGKVEINAKTIKKDESYYLPFSELDKVYNTQTNYIKENNIVTIDSLDRKYSIATANKTASVKYKPEHFSKTVAKVKQGETYIIANRKEFFIPDGWTRVRTKDGILGYVQTKKMGKHNIIRETIETKNKIEGHVSLVWDYYSQYVEAPNRKDTNIKSINVVSPSFFYLEKLGKGNTYSNVGEKGKEYIKWAKKNNYQIWPIISNDSMIETTSEIMNDYKLREKLINNIVKLITEYEVDGINIDFENMYEKDKKLFSRFLIELEPRLNEIGATLSVDVTAPDGAENWSMCYDRHTIGKVADYIIFMGYDQYGETSDKVGTTAGCDWVEANISKFLGQEGVEANKIILGIPFYTRIWKEKDGRIISNYAISMDNLKIPNNAKKEWNNDLKQYYVEYKKEGITHKIWVEDEESISAKLDLINKYKLAGAAYWKKDMEKNSIWNIISKKLEIK